MGSTMEENNLKDSIQPAKFFAVQYNINGNPVQYETGNDEDVITQWANRNTEGAKYVVIYSATLRTRLATHVELDDFINPYKKPLSTDKK